MLNMSAYIHKLVAEVEKLALPGRMLVSIAINVKRQFFLQMVSEHLKLVCLNLISAQKK